MPVIQKETVDRCRRNLLQRVHKVEERDALPVRLVPYERPPPFTKRVALVIRQPREIDENEPTALRPVRLRQVGEDARGRSVGARRTTPPVWL